LLRALTAVKVDVNYSSASWKGYGMIYYLKDNGQTIGYGRSIDEAVHIACDINRRVGDMPTEPAMMKAMIDNGTIKVGERQ
jgi:hypothetical protein